MSIGKSRRPYFHLSQPGPAWWSLLINPINCKNSAPSCFTFKLHGKKGKEATDPLMIHQEHPALMLCYKRLTKSL